LELELDLSTHVKFHQRQVPFRLELKGLTFQTPSTKQTKNQQFSATSATLRACHNTLNQPCHQHTNNPKSALATSLNLPLPLNLFDYVDL
jgi:hypothetical protein